VSQEMDEVDQEEIGELKTEVEELKRKNRLAEKENSKLKRSLSINCNLSNEKNKLERLVLEMSNEKKEQVELLVTSAFDLYEENFRLKQLLTLNLIAF
jgi:regulator of replication initiation timing